MCCTVSFLRDVLFYYILFRTRLTCYSLQSYFMGRVIILFTCKHVVVLYSLVFRDVLLVFCLLVNTVVFQSLFFDEMNFCSLFM